MLWNTQPDSDEERNWTYKEYLISLRPKETV